MQIESGSVWNGCLEIIKENVGEKSFETWFQPIKPLKFENPVLTIQVPSQWFYEWLEEHYIEVLKKAIVEVIGPQAKLQYSVIVDSNSTRNSLRT